MLALTLCTATSEHFWFSQVQLQLGALLLLAYVSQQQGRYSRAWSLITIAACLKLVPVVMLPWFVWSAPGAWRTKVTRLVPPAVVLATIVAVTWSLWRGFLETGVDVIRGNVVNRMFNYSLPSFSINLASSVFNPAQTLGASDVLWMLGVASGGLLVAAAYYACWRSRCTDETAFCVLLLVTIVAAPTAWVHYFVLAFFPFAVLVAAMRRNPSPARVALVLAVYLGMMNVGRLDYLTDNPTLKVLVSYVPLYA
ncbi:MAG: glycosyltransferase 87 family protein, partial [Acidobacteria bacterium]|nr:glycosyltransferase 87 family protein [Acidobacteriota bacterium]